MSAFLAYLAWIVWRDSQSEEAVWVGAAILLVAVFVVALATWRLRTGCTPLIVERSGRVDYERPARNQEDDVSSGIPRNDASKC